MINPENGHRYELCALCGKRYNVPRNTDLTGGYICPPCWYRWKNIQKMEGNDYEQEEQRG